jgi:hypothetical protein
MRDQYRLAEARGDRRGGMADMDRERAAADRSAVDPFRGEAQVLRHRHRRLAGGGDAVDARTCAGSARRRHSLLASLVLVIGRVELIPERGKLLLRNIINRKILLTNDTICRLSGPPKF